MINTIVNILMCIILTSCSSSSQNVIGKYRSYVPNNLNGLFHSGSYSTGSVLDISADSTFVYNLCGNILTGLWHVQNDSLIMTVQSNMYKIDSSKYYTLDIQRFYVDGKTLKRKHLQKHKSQNGKLLHRYDFLEKVD